MQRNRHTETGHDRTPIITNDELGQRHEEENQDDGKIVNQLSEVESVDSLDDHSQASTMDGNEEGGVSKRSVLSIVILTLINLLNYMDRYTIAGVLDKVMEYYKIDDTNAGLIQTSFIVSYMLLSPIFGFLGDRYNRKAIMSGGIFLWSVITLASSFVGQNYFSVFLFLRALVGIGEASYSTIAPTIIADLFAASTRTKALSVFYFAIPVGSGLGYIIGSNVANALGHWQWALRVTPALGVVCTVLILILVKEPMRGAADHGTNLVATSYSQDLKYLFKHKSFILSSLGFTCVSFVAGALAFWAPLYISKSMIVSSANKKEDTSHVALIFGVITCLAGFIGVALGSFSASKLRKKTLKADPIVCAFGLITCAPFLFLSLFVSRYNVYVTWVFIFIGETMLCLNWALVADMLLYIIIPTRRSSAEAVQILLSHLLGDAGSPFLIGAISDAVQNNYERKDSSIAHYLGLEYALYITSFVCVLGGGFFLFCALFIEKDRKETEKIIKETGDISGHRAP